MSDGQQLDAVGFRSARVYVVFVCVCVRYEVSN